MKIDSLTIPPPFVKKGTIQNWNRPKATEIINDAYLTYKGIYVEGSLIGAPPLADFIRDSLAREYDNLREFTRELIEDLHD